MAEHGGAFFAARPIAAGHIFGGRERAAVGLGAGEDVVHIRFVAAAVDGLAFFAQRGLFVEIVFAVQLVGIFRDDDAFGILSRPASDAVARVDGGPLPGPAGAQVSAPGAVAGPGRLRERLAMFVGARQAAEIRAFSRADAGDEKSHVGVLLL